MIEEPRVIHRDAVLLLAAHHDVFIQCWTGVGAASDVRRMFDAHARFVETQGERGSVALSHIASSAVKPPDEASRAIIHEHTQLLRRVRAVATVIEAGGFGAAVIRGVVSGLLLLSQREMPHQVFAAPRDGLAFVLGHRDPAARPIDLDALDRGYARVRAARGPDILAPG